MFIHFGLYSTLGGVWQGLQYNGNYSEQIESDAHIPPSQYAALASSFNPQHWDPDAIVRLAQNAGMQFIVLTSKHHDGFNLFATRQTKFNVVEATPYRRDLVKSLADACARAHMPFGVYYSTIDWHYGDTPEHANDNRLSPDHETFNARQIRELMTGYGPITEIWFDMGHPTKLQSQRFANTVHRFQPDCLVSGRVWNNQGDFLEMGDDEIPDFILDEPWESPASIFKETWGYRSWQKQTGLEEKTREHILRLVKVVSHGGNYILNIGPKGDGSVVPYEASVLRGVGGWLRTHKAALFGTQPQPFRKLDFGYATVKDNRLYLFVEHTRPGQPLVLPGLRNTVSKAYLTTDPSRALALSKTPEGDPAIALPPTDEFLPVVAVDFPGPLNVQNGPLLSPQADGSFLLLPDTAERFYNTNGEGYYDAPTLRKQQWVFSLPHSGRFTLQLELKPGKLSRVLDVSAGDHHFSPVVHASQDEPVIAGEASFASGKDSIITVEPGKPSEPGATLDLEVQRIVLKATPQ